MPTEYSRDSFFNHLFGAIAGNHALDRIPPGISTIPIDGKGGTLTFRGAKAKWLGLKSKIMQKYAYDYCFPVSSVIDRLAELDTTGERLILRAKGKGKDDLATNDWSVYMNAVLDQPNPMQSWEEFRGEQVAYKKTYGFCPVLPIVVSGFEGQPWMCSTMMNIPPWLFEAIPVSDAKVTSMFKIEDIIEKYRITILGRPVDIAPDKLFILTDTFIKSEESGFLLPQSRLVGLDFAISNLCAAMEADNVLLKKKGPLGFISHDAATKDQVSYTPMTKSYKNQLQKDLQGYGLSWDQYQYVISRHAARWNPMSFDVKGLGTKETIIAAEKAVCHRYGYPYTLYEESGTTYANGDNAAASVYTMNTIPQSKKDFNKYNKFFKAKENNCVITNDFSLVEALQEDKQYEAVAAKNMDAALKIEWESDVITLNQWREERGYDKVEGDDIYHSQWVKERAPKLQGVDPTTGEPIIGKGDPKAKDKNKDKDEE